MKPLVVHLLLILPVIWGSPLTKPTFPCPYKKLYDGSVAVTCEGLYNEQDVVKGVGSLSGRRSIYSFTIQDSCFNFIPSDAFNGTQVMELTIRNTLLRALTDTDVAFEGLERHLITLRIVECTLMQDEWDWAIFKNLARLKELKIIKSNLQSVNEDLKQVDTFSVTEISFDDNRISYLHDKTFADFRSLQYLSLSGNLITEIKRSMLPEPAQLLYELDLSDNQIEQFPTDIFERMPSLHLLSIENNNILVLHEETFKPVWSQLNSFDAVGNKLICDCRLVWILTTDSPSEITAFCAQPQNLKDKNLKDLTDNDLWCH